MPWYTLTRASPSQAASAVAARAPAARAVEPMAASSGEAATRVAPVGPVREVGSPAGAEREAARATEVEAGRRASPRGYPLPSPSRSHLCPRRWQGGRRAPRAPACRRRRRRSPIQCQLPPCSCRAAGREAAPSAADSGLRVAAWADWVAPGGCLAATVDLAVGLEEAGWEEGPVAVAWAAAA